MILLRSLATAFLMYSKIPMPRVEWRDENRRYALCCFPLIGAVIGALFLLWRWLCRLWGIGTLLNAAVCTVIPLLITGGIHLDGFCDVSDAVSSCAERPKKLEIMSDPHIGAFAAIKLGMYLLIQTALFSELSELSDFKAEIVVAIGFVMSRALSGMAAVLFKNAKSSGSLWAFSEPAHKSVTVTVLSVIIALGAAAMLIISPLCGGAAVVACCAAFIVYALYAYKQFGGITGDTAGWFLQICELAILAAAVIGEMIAKIIGGTL